MLLVTESILIKSSNTVNLPEVLYDGIFLVEWSYDGLLLKEGKK